MTVVCRKHAVQEAARAQGRALRWPDVLRCLSVSEDARKLAIGPYRAAGFGPDEFTHSAAARLCMADALTRTEDWLELHRPRVDRGEIRSVRRRLEAWTNERVHRFRSDSGLCLPKWRHGR